MRNKLKFCALISLLSLTGLCFLVIPVMGQTEVFGYEWMQYQGGIMQAESRVKFQTDAVYVRNDQGGVSPYGIWIFGKNYPFMGPTMIKVLIYVQAEYHRLNFRTRRETVYWKEAPTNFMQWNGDYHYNPYLPGKWSWFVGESYKYFSFTSSFTPNPDDHWGSGSGVSNGWRYLGKLESTYSPYFGSGNHKFHALLKLHIVNQIASYYARGYVIDYYIYEWISKIRVKLIFNFYIGKWFLWWIRWSQWKSFTHILGDGIAPLGGGGTDLNYIPLVQGQAGPVQWG